MEVVLNINNLKYNDLFDDISIYIEKNTITTISGKNNCGKTTLIRILNREIELNESIIYDGKNINEYKIEEYYKLIRSVIPKEIHFKEYIVEDEILNELDNNDTDTNKRLDLIVKKLGIKKLLDKETNNLNTKEKILIQLTLSLINKPKILLIDSIDNYFNNKEMKDILDLLKDFIKEYDLTVIMTTLNLNYSLYSNQLVIINNGKVILQGEPITILQKDNIINKAGLRIPFMIDLSVKLRDYDLIDKVELDKDRMIEQLWK